MNFTYVNSTNIAGVTVIDNNLVIKFNSGGIYEYVNAAGEYSNILNAGSKGKYFYYYIKPYYVCNKLM